MEKIVNKRVDYLDGLRGWAAFVVLLCHLYQSWLYPPGKFPFNELFYGTTFRLSLDGASAVSLFFLISSFALSFNFFMTSNYRYLIATAQFRYLRLSIPIFCSVYLTYLMYKLDLIYSVQAGAGVYMHKIHFKSLLQFCAYDVFFKSSAHYNRYGPQLWTMSVEFIGSYMVFALLFLFGVWKFRYFVYIVLLPILYDKFFGYYFLFLVGLILSDLSASIKKNPGFLKNSYLDKFARFTKIKNNLLRYINLLQTSKYKYLFDLVMFGIFIYLYQHQMVEKSKPVIPMIFFFIWTLSSVNLKLIFSSKLSRFLGRISFSLYLTHFIVLCTFPRYIYVVLNNAGYSILFTSVIVSLITFLMTIGLAYVFTVLVEEKLLKKIKSSLVKIGFIRDSKSKVPAVTLSGENYEDDYQVLVSSK